jgi:uncharacterized membrane protein
MEFKEYCRTKLNQTYKSKQQKRIVWSLFNPFYLYFLFIFLIRELIADSNRNSLRDSQFNEALSRFGIRGNYGGEHIVIVIVIIIVIVNMVVVLDQSTVHMKLVAKKEEPKERKEQPMKKKSSKKKDREKPESLVPWS